MKRRHIFRLGAGIALAASLLMALPAKAQPVLVSASPAPDSVLDAPPQSIDLIFDRALSADATTLELRSQDGTLVSTDKVIIDPANRFHASLKIPSLIPGIFEVHYTASGIGGSTLAVGSYS